MCRELGLPLKLEKVEGPATVLTFLGIVIDTVRFKLRLPEDKLEDQKAVIKLIVEVGGLIVCLY